MGRTCGNCAGCFGSTMFAAPDLQVCRLCQQRGDLITQLDEANKKIDALTREMNALREFVTSNIGTAPTNATTTNEIPSRPTSIPPVIASTVASGDPGAQLQPSANIAAPSISSNSAPDRDFQLVRSKDHRRPATKKMLYITCQNRFKILGSDDNGEEENEEVRLVGDSMVRGQLKEFCARSPRTRKRYCIPGGGVDDVIAAADEVSKLAPANTTYVIHVGTNDVQQTRSEELLDKYRRLIRTYREKSPRIIVSGIVPRLGVEDRFYDIAASTNRRLENLCKEEHVGFVSTWDDFYYDHSLFLDDGVHFNMVGAARFGRLLDNGLKAFRSKNGLNHVQHGRTL